MKHHGGRATPKARDLPEQRRRHDRCFLSRSHAPGVGWRRHAASTAWDAGGAEARGRPWTSRVVVALGQTEEEPAMIPHASCNPGGRLAAPARLPYVAKLRRLLDRLAPDGSARWT